MAELTATQELQILINRVRSAMRDYPKLNVLIMAKENGDRDIAMAIQETVDLANATPPLISGQYTWHTMPAALLISGAIARLQLQVADLDDRNFLPANDGQVSSPYRQKGQLVRQAAQMRWAEVRQMITDLKTATNLQKAMGGKGLSSDEDAWSVAMWEYLYRNPL